MAWLKPSPPSLLLTATLVGLFASQVHSDRPRGIGADLAAAEHLTHLDAQRIALNAPSSKTNPSDVPAKLTGLRAATRAQARELYRLSRAGLAHVASDFDAARRHFAHIALLKRRLRTNIAMLAQLEGELATLPTTRAQPPAQKDARPPVADNLQLPALPVADVHTPMDEAGLDVQPSGDEFYGIRVHDEKPKRGHFASLKGRLASPVVGDLQVGEASRRGGNYTGIELRVPTGSIVRAVAAGRVAFSDAYGDYGNLVILDHEDGFYTLYGGLNQVDVRVGDDLSQRARIGDVASENATSALFFGVRKGSRSLPARPWLGL